MKHDFLTFKSNPWRTEEEEDNQIPTIVVEPDGFPTPSYVEVKEENSQPFYYLYKPSKKDYNICEAKEERKLSKNELEGNKEDSETKGKLTKSPIQICNSDGKEGYWSEIYNLIINWISKSWYLIVEGKYEDHKCFRSF